MSKVFYWLLVCLGIALFVWGAYDQTVLHWNNPDMTGRRIWLEYQSQMLFITARVFGGAAIFVVAHFIKD